MARNLKSVNWFRFTIIICLSLNVSLVATFSDEYISTTEIINALLQMTLTGLAFLQCPEDLNKK